MTGLPPPKKIIRGAKVEGIVFSLPQDPQHEKEKKITPQTGKIKDLENTLQEAQKIGYRQGLKDGHEQGYETGKNEGVDIGYHLGLESGEAKVKQTLQLLNKISESFAARQEEMFVLAKPELIKFSLTVCENLIHHALTDPKVFLTQITSIFDQAKEILKDSSVSVVLAQEDLDLFQNNLNELIKKNEEFKKIKFISDSTVQRGNCRVESSLGLLNFDIKRLLDDIEKKALEASSSPPKE